MKIGVSSYSFSTLVENGTMNQLDVVSKAKEMGFDIIEFSTISVPEGETLSNFALKIREECDRVGIGVGNYTIWADFLNGSNGDWKAEVERLKDEVKIARILGSPGMRHDVSWGFPSEYKGAKGYEDALPTLVKACRAVTEFAEAMGIRTMTENHGFFSQDSQRVERLINGVNHSNFGALIDMGNFLCVDEEPEKAVGRLMPYAFHIHAKDFHFKSGQHSDPGEGWSQTRGGNYLRASIIGHGNVPIAQCLKVMKRSNYEGILSIEFEGMEDPIKGISIGLNNLNRYIREIFR